MSGGRWVLAGLAGLALFAWLAGWRDESANVAPRVTVPDVMVPARAVAAAAPAASAASAVPTAAPARADSPWVPVALELCGVGTLHLQARRDETRPAPDEVSGMPAHLGNYAVDAARAELLRALAAGPPRWQASAALMSGDDEGLRRVALAGQDAVALGWAAARCRGDAACIAEPLARWLAMEPENAVPWLQLWQSQPARREEALAGLRRATRFRAGWAQLAEATTQALPPHTLPYLHVPLIVEAIGIEAALPDPSGFALLRLCPAGLPPGSPRHAECDGFARLLVEQADTMIAHGVGIRLGERAGWPPERTEPLREALREASTAAAAGLFDLQQPYGCAGVRRLRAWVGQVARVGEVAALRATAPSPPR